MIEVSAEEKERALRETFSDTLDKSESIAGIIVAYREGRAVRVEIGVPYSVSSGFLEIGPYVKDSYRGSVPEDYEIRKKRIGLHFITNFRRIEISDLI